MSEVKNINETPIFHILSNVKGVCSDTMLSMLLSSHDHVGELVKSLEGMFSLSKHKYEDEKDFFGMFSDDFDADVNEYKHRYLVLKEAMDFVKGLRWQDTDKADMGLIIYYGHIRDKDGDDKEFSGSKKLYHTFPCPKSREKCLIKTGDRFDMSLLLSNPWV